MRDHAEAVGAEEDRPAAGLAVGGIDARGQAAAGSRLARVSPRLPGISITDSTASVSMISSTSS
jgi:hypothetical protein